MHMTMYAHKHTEIRHICWHQGTFLLQTRDQKHLLFQETGRLSLLQKHSAQSWSSRCPPVDTFLSCGQGTLTNPHRWLHHAPPEKPPEAPISFGEKTKLLGPPWHGAWHASLSVLILYATVQQHTEWSSPFHARLVLTSMSSFVLLLLSLPSHHFYSAKSIF